MKFCNSCISWYGGKGGNAQRELINFITDYINNSDEKIFVDVFGGSGVVTLNIENKDKKYNDINKNLVNFFKVLNDPILSLELKGILCKTLYCQNVYEDAVENLKNKNYKEEKSLEKAVDFYIATNQSVNSIGAIKKTGFKFSKGIIRNNMGQAVSAWITNINVNLPKVIDKFRKVEVYNCDFSEIIDKFDSENTIFYLDPPYVINTRKNKKVYEYELDDERHNELIEKLLKIKGKAILSGYDSDIYKKLETNGWNRKEFIIKSTSGHAESKNTRKEIVWYK